TARRAVRLQIEMSLQDGQHVVGGDGIAALPFVAGVQGHLFDDAQLVSVVEAEPQQRDGVVKPGDRIEYRVHLYRVEPRGLRGLESFQYVVQPVATGDVDEACGVDGVERDVDPVKSGPLELGG